MVSGCVLKRRIETAVSEFNSSQCFFSLSAIFSDSEVVVKRKISDMNTELSDSSASPGTKSILNPYAKEWNPVTERAPEDDRSLFVTFSNGYPLTETEIISFFNREFGNCVENVYVRWPEIRNKKWKIRALFGNVLFTKSYIPAVILNGENEVKFWIDRKPLWCKRFIPERKSSNSD